MLIMVFSILSKMNALLIEDHVPTAELLSRVLRRSGIAVTRCGDAESAMELLLQGSQWGNFSLILVDIGLPGRDGITFSQWVREQRQLVQPYLVIVTGQGREEALAKALAAGANDYIEKPVDPKNLSLRLAIAKEHMASHHERQMLRSQLDDEQEMVGVLFDTAGAFLVAFDNSAQIKKFNPACQNLTPKADLNGESLYESLFPEPEIQEIIASGLGSKAPDSGEFNVEVIHTGKNCPQHVEWTFRRISRRPDESLWIASGADVTSHRLAAEKLARAAERDPLTQLYNRTHLEPALEEAALLCNGEATSAVLCVDLDHFKTVNDTAGHAAGDEMLKLVAATLVSTVRPSDTIVRTGGDEFVIILPKAPPLQAREIAERVRTSLAALAFTVDGTSFSITASIGIAMMEPNRPAKDILELADAASYSSKTKGRNKVTTSNQKDFQTLGEAETPEDRLWYQRIVTAIDYHTFDLWLQPIIALSTDETAFSEALLRLPSSSGWDSPASFLHHARRHNLLVDIDRAVIDSALDILQTHPTLVLSINLTGVTISDPRLPEFLRQATRRTAVSPSRLIIEITESDLIHDIDRVSMILRDLSREGYRFALDDFGEGYSAFACLRNLPLEIVKIDGSFTNQLAIGSPNHAFMKAIRELTTMLNISCVAERVECQSDLDQVRALGMDYAQGFLLGHPEPLHPHFSASRNLAPNHPPAAILRSLSLPA